jgi:hypothetical protein
MLLRAEFTLNGNFEKFDFVGDNAERDFLTWLSETAKSEERFQYLGSQRMNHPVCWRYTEQGTLEVWDSLLPIGEAGLIITNSDDITWFFEEHLGVPIGEIHVGDEDLTECPKAWFQHDYSMYDDVIMVSEELEEETDLKSPEKMSAFEVWFRTFVEEKDLPVVNWEIEHGGNLHFIDNYDMVEIICELPAENQAQIKDKLVAIDFMNGNVNHFLKFLAEGYIASYFSNQNRD